MSILLTVYNRLLVDICELSGVPLGVPDEITMDWVLKEGPALEKQILIYLENGGLEPVMPEWLKPLWDRFIVTDDGLYLRYIRQVLLFCYKAELKPTNEQTTASQDAFVNTEEGVGIWNTAFGSRPHSATHSTARQIVTSVVRECSRRGKFKQIIPGHGPGAVFPPRNPWSKSCFLTLYSSIQPHYPYDQFFCGLHSFWKETMVDERSGPLVEQDDIIANLIAVPKDSRGPRLICVHPAEAIWIQQGQRSVLEDAITQSSLTAGKINFTDQTVNGQLALASSVTRELVTLDLKEASDRISSELVRYLFGETVYELLSCSRANKVKLLDGRVITLQKWAPMGNCLTFPVQSLIFWALVRASIVSRYGVNCTDIYVFGDDILYPSKYHDCVVNGLVSSGLIPNMNKTFVKGFFRESCGVDAYKGIDVTPFRMKAVDVNSTESAVSVLDLAKRMRIAGYVGSSAYLYSLLSGRYGRLPLSNNPDATGFVEYVDRDLVSLILCEPKMRFKRTVHTWGVPNLMVKAVVNDGYTRDWYHVQDSLLELARLGNRYSDRRRQYTVPYRAQLTYGWTNVVVRSKDRTAI